MWGEWEYMKEGYESKINDPWDWVTHFENAVARYTGANMQSLVIQTPMQLDYFFTTLDLIKNPIQLRYQITHMYLL